jgi:hypothetical protein
LRCKKNQLLFQQEASETRASLFSPSQYTLALRKFEADAISSHSKLARAISKRRLPMQRQGLITSNQISIFMSDAYISRANAGDRSLHRKPEPDSILWLSLTSSCKNNSTPAL